MSLLITDVTDFGAIADWNGTTGTDNRAAFQSAIDAAVSQKRPLRIPFGSYYIDSTTEINIPGDLRIFGDGSLQTFIKIGPDIQPAQKMITLRAANGINVALQGMTFEGPETPYPQPSDPNEVTHDYDTTVLRSHDEPMNGMVLNLIDVKASRFRNAFWLVGAISGANRLAARDCSLRSYETNVLVESIGEGDECIVENCDFHVQDSSPGSTDESGHCLYLTEGVSLCATRCRFHSSDAYGIRMAGGGNAGRANYAMIDSCYFAQQVTGAIILSKKTETQISNCVFELGSPDRGIPRDRQIAVGIEVRAGGATVQNCTFRMMDPNARRGEFLRDSALETGPMRFTGCVFTGDTNAVHKMILRVSTPLVATDNAWTFDQCTFEGAASQLFALESGGNHLHFTRCQLGATSASSIKSGLVTVDSCQWSGAGNFEITGELGPTTVEVRNSRLSGGKLYCKGYPSGSDMTVLLDSNVIEVDPIFTDTLDGIGQLEIRGANNTFKVDSFTFQTINAIGYLRPLPKTGPDIASESTIWLLPGCDLYYVTGSTDIDTIDLGSRDSTGQTSILGSFRGPFTLIAKDAMTWKLTTSGNIIPKNTATRCQWEAVQLIYAVDSDGTGKWHEI